MITISVCNHKGGTAKTTTTLMLAAAAGLSGRRVLVVDLDPQGFLTDLVGVPEPRPEESSCMIFAEARIDGPLPVRALSGFDLLASSPRLSADQKRLNRPTDVFWGRDFVASVSDSYDLLFIDTAAALTVFSLNALVACNWVVIPVLPEHQPVHGAEQTYQTAGTVRKSLNPGLVDARFLLTMVDGRKKDHHTYAQYLRERYGSAVLKTVIRTSASLSMSRSNGQTAFDRHPGSRGAIDYANVADELLAAVEEGVFA